MEKIICAAIHYDDGTKHLHQPQNISSGFVVCGRRHHNCITTAYILGNKITVRENMQGFITTLDRFVNRSEAMKIALAANQVKGFNEDNEVLISEMLYSENLY